MIELIALRKETELGKMVGKIINIFCVLMFPVTIACVLFRTELVAAVFQRGSFADESTALTSGVFSLYCIGLFFIASNTVVTNLFYGYGDTKTPMYISIANLGINVVFNLVFIHLWGVNGLALATSISAIITFFVRIKTAGKYVKLDNKQMIITSIKVFAAAAVACLIPRLIFWVHPINRYMTLVASAAIGIVVYLVTVKMMRVPEIDDLINLLKRRLRKV